MTGRKYQGIDWRKTIPTLKEMEKRELIIYCKELQQEVLELREYIKKLSDNMKGYLWQNNSHIR
jgi:hypothetical protein